MHVNKICSRQSERSKHSQENPRSSGSNVSININGAPESQPSKPSLSNNN